MEISESKTASLDHLLDEPLENLQKCRRGGHWRPHSYFIDSNGRETVTCCKCLDNQRKRRSIKYKYSAIPIPDSKKLESDHPESVCTSMEDMNANNQEGAKINENIIEQVATESNVISLAESENLTQNDCEIDTSECLQLCKRGRHWRPHKTFIDVDGTETATCLECLTRQRKKRDLMKMTGVTKSNFRLGTDPNLSACITSEDMAGFISGIQEHAKANQNIIDQTTTIFIRNCSAPKELSLYIRDKILEGTGYYFTFNAFSSIKRNAYNSVAHFYCSQDLKRKWEPKKIELSNVQYRDPKPTVQTRDPSSVKVFDCEGKLCIHIDTFNCIAEIMIYHKGHVPYNGKIMRELCGLKHRVKKDELPKSTFTICNHEQVSKNPRKNRKNKVVGKLEIVQSSGSSNEILSAKSSDGASVSYHESWEHEKNDILRFLNRGTGLVESLEETSENWNLLKELRKNLRGFEIFSNDVKENANMSN